ncbi:hypothetical protein LTR62_008435 [Meristemomyces frigidus]|uniref:cAMP-dependent protein kinase regulatory subunit n=1 Tax=Meristemomyces frigidus TaxID=1508187 RepID=A0AAN7YN87_9PEZI|nr:hypothetical protein LTR62_008435 [Meristemomyces frigidus]
MSTTTAIASSSSASKQPQHPDLTREIAALEREASKQQPSDILQFCSNFFHRRLESQRHEFLLAQQHSSASSFSGVGNPFGATSAANNNTAGGLESGSAGLSGMAAAAGAGREMSPGGARGIHSVAEEEEHDLASPTATSFPANALSSHDNTADAPAHASSNSNSNSAPSDGGSTFGSFAGFGGGSSPFGNNANRSTTTSAPTSNTMDSSGSFPTNYNMTRRTSVSAESLAPASADDASWSPPQYPKTADQLSRLRTAVSHNFLFSHLDDDQTHTVLNALQERKVPAKDVRVIVQGDAGDYFYVVESGSFDIHVSKSGKMEAGPDGMGAKVGSSGPGQSFGELALMYNAPRAATVVSAEPAVLWQLDRVTFRRILMDSAFQRRRMYESFLEEVPLLSSLTAYERSKVADALETHKFPAGSVIIREGDVGDQFYLLESGRAEAVQKGRVLKQYGKGDYFGELALLDDRPRAATVRSLGEVKVAALGKDGFTRLLGSVEGLMRRDDPRRG